MANILRGKLVSQKTPNTVIVEVERYFAHPIYKKRVRRTKRYKAQYEGKELALGERVEIIETKPISKDKHFKVKL